MAGRLPRPQRRSGPLRSGPCRPGIGCNAARALILALKLSIAPCLVMASSLAGRRWGPQLVGLLVVLPLVAGPILGRSRPLIRIRQAAGLQLGEGGRSADRQTSARHRLAARPPRVRACRAVRPAQGPQETTVKPPVHGIFSPAARVICSKPR